MIETMEQLNTHKYYVLKLIELVSRNKVLQQKLKDKTQIKLSYILDYSLRFLVFKKEMNSLYSHISPSPKAHKGLCHEFGSTSKKNMRSIFNNDD